MPEKGCICQICTCGRCRCPVCGKKPNNFKLGDDKECKVTEYNNKYRPYDINAKPKPFKPEPQLLQDGAKLDDMTTFKNDYIQHPLQPKYQHKGDLYEKPAGNMDTVTTYGKDYPAKAADKTRSLKPNQAYDRGGVPFEGHPTYKDDYKQWQVDRTKAIKKDHMYMPPTAAMENATTFRTDFIPRDLPKTKSFKPDNMAMVSKEPFDDVTNHKMNFVNHPLPEKFRKERDQYRPNREPLDSMTTAQRDFVGYALPKIESFKPKNSGIQSDAPLDDATEFKDSYKQWQMPKRDSKAKEMYQKPPGIMDSTTSHRKDYIAHKLDPARSLKPLNVMSGNEAPFDDSTTFKADFKPWQASNQLRKDPSRKNYEMPSQPFDGMPTYKAHYIEHGLNPTKSFKPDNFLEANRAPFEGDSMYKTEYTQKRNEICPVVAGLHGYEYVSTDASGHKHYEKK